MEDWVAMKARQWQSYIRSWGYAYPKDLTYCTETIEDHLTDTTAKGFVKCVIGSGSLKKEMQISNVYFKKN